jgi:hypothetical protein
MSDADERAWMSKPEYLLKHWQAKIRSKKASEVCQKAGICVLGINVYRSASVFWKLGTGVIPIIRFVRPSQSLSASISTTSLTASVVNTNG